MQSTTADGPNGFFFIPGPERATLRVQASNGGGWEHVSVSVYRKERTPTWAEMCFVKDLFWDKDEVVIQYHPREADYVKCHKYVLHMWRPIGQTVPTPPTWMVGPVGVEVQEGYSG